MKVFEILLGILVFPFVWIHDRLIRGNPASPPEFWMFIKALDERGVNARLQMQKLALEGVSESAIIVLDPGASGYEVMNLFKLDTEETANEKLTELESNPLMSHCRQRERYLMSVTFLEPNEELATKVTEAFAAFQKPPNNRMQSDPAKLGR